MLSMLEKNNVILQTSRFNVAVTDKRHETRRFHAIAQSMPDQLGPNTLDCLDPFKEIFIMVSVLMFTEKQLQGMCF